MSERSYQVKIAPRPRSARRKTFDNQRGEYASYNVAKLMIEFSTSIPRERLQPVFGAGFYGAPLNTVEPSHIPSARDQGGHQRGKSRAKKGSSSGGPRHV
jgi:hypothetical protein